MAALSLGLLPFAVHPSCCCWLWVWFAQALIFPSILALMLKILFSHTGAGVGLIGSFKNSGKIVGPIIGGLIIHWHDFSWMLWSMAALLAPGVGFTVEPL
ncbi:MAG: hypothetical protein Ct9H300mP28_03860 [Pseudomonadota bacterium]|nr:MAG: hypothetical protein Ct9H300mP28_03860 [Pseudomonadota bacterium]